MALGFITGIFPAFQGFWVPGSTDMFYISGRGAEEVVAASFPPFLLRTGSMYRVAHMTLVWLSTYRLRRYQDPIYGSSGVHDKEGLRLCWKVCLAWNIDKTRPEIHYA